MVLEQIPFQDDEERVSLSDEGLTAPQQENRRISGSPLGCP